MHHFSSHHSSTYCTWFYGNVTPHSTLHYTPHHALHHTTIHITKMWHITPHHTCWSLHNITHHAPFFKPHHSTTYCTWLMWLCCRIMWVVVATSHHHILHVMLLITSHSTYAPHHRTTLHTILHVMLLWCRIMLALNYTSMVCNV